MSDKKEEKKIIMEDDDDDFEEFEDEGSYNKFRLSKCALKYWWRYEIMVFDIKFRQEDWDDEEVDDEFS